MKRNRIAEIILILLSILCLFIVSHIDRGFNMKADAKVRIGQTAEGTRLYKNGEPFYIKGASGERYFKELAEIGGNTIRIYDTTNISLKLDEAHRHGLSVIVDFHIPIYGGSYNPYSDINYRKGLYLKAEKFINKYKSHPALLFWNLGNEVLYPFDLVRNDFIDTFNELISIFHRTDPDHPIGTTISGLSERQVLGILLHSPEIDLLGFNVFSKAKDLESFMNLLSLFTKVKPYYVSEWGVNGPWEMPRNSFYTLKQPDQDAQNLMYKESYDKIKTDKSSLGSLVFYWGTKNEGTPTWFNIFDSEGNKSLDYYYIEKLWNEKETELEFNSRIDSISIDDYRFSEDVVLSADQQFNVTSYTRNIDDSVKIKWQLYKEGWGNQSWKKIDSFNFQSAKLDKDGKLNFKFKSPIQEGPYRLFVKFTTHDGKFLSSNIPFYVLDRLNHGI